MATRYGALTLQIKALSNLADIGGTDTNIISARGAQLLNRVGSGSFTISTRENNTNIQAGRVAYLYMSDAVTGLNMDVATFIIDSVDVTTAAGGARTTVSGVSLLDQLSYETLDDDAIDDGSGGVDTDDVTNIMGYAPSGWSLSMTGTGTTNGTYHTSRGDTVLEMLIAAAKQSGEIFRLNAYSPPTKVVNWRAAPDSSGITLRMPATPSTYDGSTTTGIILSLSEDTDFKDVVTRIRPYGAGVGEGRLDITTLSVTDPSGYTTTPASNLIVNNTLESSLGYNIKRDVDFAHIQAQDITVPTQVTTAKTALWNEAINYLQERDSSKAFYRIRCVVPYDFRPGQTVDVVYAEYQGGISGGSQVVDIDDTFTIHEVTNDVGADGIRYTSLLVGDSLQPKPEPMRSVARAIDTTRKTTRKSDVGTSPGSVSVSRTINTQDPVLIDGGNVGDLSSDRTLTLGTLNGFGSANQVLGITAAGGDVEYKTISAGANMTVNHTAGDIELVAAANAPTDATFVTLSTNGTLTNERVLTAGDGVDLTDGGAGSTATLAIDVTDILGNGITEASNNVTLGTPSSLDVGTANAVTSTSHTHAIVTSSSVTTFDAFILSTDSNGQVETRGYGAGSSPSGYGDMAYVGDLEPYRLSALVAHSFVPLTTPWTHPSWSLTSYSTVSTPTKIDMSTFSGAPANTAHCHAYLLEIVTQDSASWGTGGLFFACGPSSTYWYSLQCRPYGNDIYSTACSIVPSDLLGDIYYQIGASGSSTLDVNLRVWGYFT